MREQLLAKTHDELPHSISCRVTEWEWPHIRCEIIVERDSQKGIVIGHKGSRLRDVGIEARQQIQALLGTPVHLDLHVKIAKDWQRNPRQLRRLGFYD